MFAARGLGRRMRYLRTDGIRWATMVAMLGLWMQLFLPLAQAIAFDREGGGQPFRMIICTQFGAQIIDLLTGEEVPDSEADRETCSVCLSYSIGTAALDNAADNGLVVPRFGVLTTTPLSELILTSQAVMSCHGARAPPVHS